MGMGSIGLISADAVDALHIHDEALLDSGCSWHVFTSPDFFVHLRPLPPATSQLKVANGAKVAIEGEGEVALRVNLKYNLLSVSALEDEGYNTRMDSRTAAHADRATNNEYTTREAPAAAHAARPQDATYPVRFLLSRLHILERFRCWPYRCQRRAEVTCCHCNAPHVEPPADQRYRCADSWTPS
mmetsp:Transcript_15832/g.37732  ORF Transcript_15832/g.37732 Transcript_15832/m.37732 type:complete len:185 (-) Transcript_15832:204-758(-)